MPFTNCLYCKIACCYSRMPYLDRKENSILSPSFLDLSFRLHTDDFLWQPRLKYLLFCLTFYLLFDNLSHSIRVLNVCRTSLSHRLTKVLLKVWPIKRLLKFESHDAIMLYQIFVVSFWSTDVGFIAYKYFRAQKIVLQKSSSQFAFKYLILHDK